MRRLSPFWVLVILTGLNLFNYLDRAVLAAVLESISKDWGLNDSQGGMLATAFMIGYFVTAPLFGYLGDRTSRKWLIALGVTIWSLGTVLSGVATGFVSLLLYRVLVGVGEASYGTISPGVISDVYPAEKRNNVLTLFYVAIPVGSALGFVLGGQFADWRHAFIWAGAPGFVLALLMLPFADPPRLTSASEAKPGVKEIGRLFNLKVRELWNYHLVVWGYAAHTFVLGALAIWGSTFFQRVHGMDKGKAGLLVGEILVIAGLVGTFLGGFAATAWQKRCRSGYALTLGISVILAAPALVMAFLATTQFAAVAGFAVGIFLLFAIMGPVNTLILETAPVNLRSSAMAGSIFIIHLFGDLWSPALVGFLSDRLGLREGLLFLPAVLLIAGGLWLFLAKRQHAAPPTVEPSLPGSKELAV